MLALQDPSAPTSAPATQSTLEQLRAEHRELVDQEFSTLPRRDPLPIEKIVSLTLEDGHLHVKPLLEPTNGSVAIDATNWPGKMHVTVGAPQALMMHIKHVDLSKPDLIATYTQIITGADYLQISRDSESDKGLSSITLIQSRQFADENDDPIRLTARYVSDVEGGPDVNVQISGSSFETMRRDHPREMQKYLLPILQDLQAANLLRLSDPVTAWQVLANEVKIDPKLRDRVSDLVQKLSSPEFADRVLAEEQLTQLGAPAAIILMRMDHSKLAADPKATVDTMIRAHTPLPDQRVADLRKDLPFLCDTLLLDEPALRQAAIVRIGDLTGKSIDLPDTLSDAEKTKRIDAFRATIIPATQPAK